MAFLDEQLRDRQGRDGRGETGRRPRDLPLRRRQRFLVRRLVAVTILLALLIALVLGIRGCLNARSHKALRTYATQVGTIMNQSAARGRGFSGCSTARASPARSP